MTGFYDALCRMPHLQPDALHRPPPEGWPDVDVATLKARGKSDHAIDFVGHLPHLAHRTMITMNTVSIDLSDGKTCPAWAEELIETPGYVVWIGNQDCRDGFFLLLDTMHGTITELGTVNDTCRLPEAEYNALPTGDRWMVHSTMTAEDWFTRERLRVEHLIYMRLPGSTEFFFRASLPEDEHDIITNAAADDEHDYEDSTSNSDSDDAESPGEGMEVDEVVHLSEENAGLLVPATPALETDEAPHQSSSNLHPTPYEDMHPGTEKPEVAELLAIYTLNGCFSDSWDREGCRTELLQWAQARRDAHFEAESLRNKTMESKYQAAKQANLEQHLRIKRVREEKRQEREEVSG